MFAIIDSFFSYIYILQSSVETYLWCGGIYNNWVIANCLQSVPVKEFCKLVNNWWKYGQKKTTTFFIGPQYICLLYTSDAADE